MSEQREPRRVDRRTIAKGAAWAVPAVPLIVATPAYATSGPPPTITLRGFCKLPGNACDEYFTKGYVTEVTITNTTALPIYLYDTAAYPVTITEDNPDLDLVFEAAVYADGPNEGDLAVFPILLGVGQTVVLTINAGTEDESSNEAMTLTVTVPWGHTAAPEDDDETVNGDHVPVSDSGTFESAPPYQNPACLVNVPC